MATPQHDSKPRNPLKANSSKYNILAIKSAIEIPASGVVLDVNGQKVKTSDCLKGVTSQFLHLEKFSLSLTCHLQSVLIFP